MASEHKKPEPIQTAFARSSLGRADLLWAWFGCENLPQQDFAGIASILGYQAKTEPAVTPAEYIQQSNIAITQQAQPQEQETPAVSSKLQLGSYYRVTNWQPAPMAWQQPQPPDWLTKHAEDDLLKLKDSLVPAEHQLPPALPPLAPWSRLLPFLLKTLGASLPGRKADMPKLVKLLSSAVQVARLPKQQRYQWQRTITVLIDINQHNFPYRADFLALKDKLSYWRGTEGLDIQFIDQLSELKVKRLGQQQSSRWQAPDSQTPLLILSDLGMLGDGELLHWLAFGQRLQRLNRRATVLMPVAARQLDPRLTRYFNCVVWDNHSHFRPLHAAGLPEDYPEQHQQQIQQLLALCYPALRVNLGLLRSLRQLLPKCDIGHENAIWQQSVLQSQDDEWAWLAEGKVSYVDDFKLAYHGLSPAKQQSLLQQLARSQARIADVLYFEVVHELNRLGISYSQQLEQATLEYMAKLVNTYKINDAKIGLNAWGSRFLARLTQGCLTEQQYALQFYICQRNKLELPPDFPQPLLTSLKPNSSAQTLIVRQHGQYLQIATEANTATTGLELLRLPAEQTVVSCKYQDAEQQWQLQVQDVTQQPLLLVLPASEQDYTLEINQHQLTLAAWAAEQLPDWLQAYKVSNNQTTIETLSAKQYLFTWYWQPPCLLAKQDTAATGKSSTSPGFWYYQATLSVSPQEGFSDCQRDEFGLYCDVNIAGVIQRFRWIAPGQFVMGSPEDENGRYDREIQHPVILSQGYWLADTACSQALWQAVMGENPSHFKGKNLPVETVSWDAVQQFLDKVNQLQPWLNLRLPSEAEWEYACRAGSQSAFNFAETISLATVNYCGNWDSWEMADGSVGQTAPVKNYTANAWGLYQMHGNVWEWCHDNYGSYPAQLVTDPLGPDTGDYRVLRGGAWDYDGGICRSAFRNNDLPDFAFSTIGFRLSRGHQVSQSGWSSALPPEGTHAAAARAAQPGAELRTGFAKLLDKLTPPKRKK